jgi:serine/threonine protein kinase
MNLVAQSSNPRLSFNASNPECYALKECRKDLTNSFLQIATIDLAVEATFLRTLNHPNIISLHSTGHKPGSKDYFIVIEKLEKTLDKKIQDWSNDFNQQFKGRSYATSELEGMSRKQQFQENKRALVKDQLKILMGAASALQFLHEQR